MELLWRPHNSSGGMVRVWREDWAGDMFEIMTRDNLNTLRELGAPFGLTIRQVEDDD